MPISVTGTANSSTSVRKEPSMMAASRPSTAAAAQYNTGRPTIGISPAAKAPQAATE